MKIQNDRALEAEKGLSYEYATLLLAASSRKEHLQSQLDHATKKLGLIAANNEVLTKSAIQAAKMMNRKRQHKK
jgi:hypothetical protein